jgi:hypothetical protein
MSKKIIVRREQITLTDKAMQLDTLRPFPILSVSQAEYAGQHNSETAFE